MVNPLAGKPLRYVIGKDDDNGAAQTVTEVGYGAARLPIGYGVKYVNLRDEENSGAFGPYKTEQDDIDRQYNEPAPLASGEGFWANLRQQLDRARTQGFVYVELDNLDTYDVATALKCFDECAKRGLLVLAKNPINVDGDVASLVGHAAVRGVIVEKGAGTAVEMDTLRRTIGQPDLSVWFVTFGDGRPFAQSMADSIRAHSFGNMGVTYDRAADEYGGEIEDMVKPLPSVFEPGTVTAPSPAPAQINGAAIIAKARSFKGKFHDGPDVPMLARAIGQTFPELAKYCTEASNSMPWCGDFVAYVLAGFGIRPPPVKDDVGFFYVDRWLDFGTPVPVGQQQPGDVAIFLGNPHHVTFVAGGGKYVGGNQSDAVTEATFRTPDAIRRPVWSSVIEPPPPPIAVVNTKIIATNFHDDEVAYTDVASGWNDRFGVALPWRFPKGKRPKVKVTNRANGKSVICEIIDIGPAYDNRPGYPYDPYWQTPGKRPRAESDPRTNGAAIDLTLPADAAIGLDGKGLVDWEFVGADQPIPPAPLPVDPTAPPVDATIAQILQRLAALEKRMSDLSAPTLQPVPAPTTAAPIDVAATLARFEATIAGMQKASQSPLWAALKPLLPSTGVWGAVLGFGVLFAAQYFDLAGTAVGVGGAATPAGGLLTGLLSLLGAGGVWGKISQVLGRLAPPKQ